MRSILERSLVWPWGVFGQCLVIITGYSAIRQGFICRSHVNHEVLILIFSSNSAQMVSCRFLNFAKSQPQIHNCHTFLTSVVYYWTAVLLEFAPVSHFVRIIDNNNSLSCTKD